jgi:hypothetical protein
MCQSGDAFNRRQEVHAIRASRRDRLHDRPDMRLQSGLLLDHADTSSLAIRKASIYSIFYRAFGAL